MSNVVTFTNEYGNGICINLNPASAALSLSENELSYFIELVHAEIWFCIISGISEAR